MSSYRISMVTWIVLVLAGCSSRSAEVHFIVPVDYRGFIVVWGNRSDGTIVEQSRGKYTLRVPKTGILKLKSRGPLYSWHSTSAAFDDGTPLPYGNDKDALTKGIALWSLESAPDYRAWYFVGTHEDYLKAKGSIPHWTKEKGDPSLQ